MRQLKMTRSELADQAALSRGYISDLLNGKRGKRIGADVLQRLATALQVEPIFFADGDAYANGKPLTNRKPAPGKAHRATPQ